MVSLKGWSFPLPALRRAQQRKKSGSRINIDCAQSLPSQAPCHSLFFPTFSEMSPLSRGARDICLLLYAHKGQVGTPLLRQITPLPTFERPRQTPRYHDCIFIFASHSFVQAAMGPRCESKRNRIAQVHLGAKIIIIGRRNRRNMWRIVFRSIRSPGCVRQRTIYYCLIFTFHSPN